MLDKKPSQSNSSLNVEALIDCNVITSKRSKFKELSCILMRHSFLVKAEEISSVSILTRAEKRLGKKLTYFVQSI